ncbi:hypothetical protein EDB92DRAFT_563805 [Lactarius akahatsu]|uniref:Secreted protein n=1 Tax=Lactarius akahatsu TaxID=416441 RepID=A0AAD4LM71_9AGAM|nr:hypothetical protein EDB92DRAFT_563805 [Lactarius akahatsu]
MQLVFFFFWLTVSLRACKRQLTPSVHANYPYELIDPPPWFQKPGRGYAREPLPIQSDVLKPTFKEPVRGATLSRIHRRSVVCRNLNFPPLHPCTFCFVKFEPGSHHWQHVEPFTSFYILNLEAVSPTDLHVYGSVMI